MPKTSTLRVHLQRSLAELPEVERALMAGQVPNLASLEESARVFTREIGRLASGGPARARSGEWWECSACRAKLAAVTGLTVSVCRADVRVDVARVEGVVIEATCPRCKLAQAFPS